jgi:SAM-dependent methyltransferase
MNDRREANGEARSGRSSTDAVQPRLPDWVICPSCGSAILDEGPRLCCSRCGSAWPIIDGIPHFVNQFPYWGEISLERMREVNAKAKSGNWKAALTEHPDPTVQRASEMILNLERANWQYLMDQPETGRALDLGAGTGTTSHALALRYREVAAVEPVLERAQFMQERFAQEGLCNVTVVMTSLWELPFPPETFDLVVMNGVLEWVAEGKDGDPGEIQLAALRKARSLLRPGGYLYVGIENRLCPGYFIGYSDPHCRLPYVTILPRPLAQWYAKRKGQSGYRNYLYSSGGYKRLLRDAGFGSVDLYVALPSYNHPRFLVPLDAHLFSYYSRTFNSRAVSGVRRLATELLLKLGVMQHLEYSFAILARR